MHRDDLFDESCARPRHADDEYGCRIAAAEFGSARHEFACAAANQAIDLEGERDRIERLRAAAHGIGRVEMLHGQGIVAQIVRRLADREVKPQALRCFQPRREQCGFHPSKQILVIARDPAAPDQIIVASRQQRRDRDRALKAFAGLVEMAKLREHTAQ
jgi:hypothetical protein